MTFCVQRRPWRLWDPERGIEIKSVGGGSDSSMDYEISTPDRVSRYSLRGYPKGKLTQQELDQLGPEYNKTPYVVTVTHWDRSMRSLIEEALLVERRDFVAYAASVNPDWQNVDVFIHFGSHYLFPPAEKRYEPVFKPISEWLGGIFRTKRRH